MPSAPAITDLEQLKQRPELGKLLGSLPDAVAGARLDRGDFSITVRRADFRQACAILRDDTELQFNYLCDVTCVDWFPSEPRFEVVYQLLSMTRKARLTLKVELRGDDAWLDSLTAVWPAANYFEREVFDLFGVRFEGHPYLRRIMMPENWEGHPLRKDYPVEGYR
jgi:NADH-quinone oxidoreductase subunit C